VSLGTKELLDSKRDSEGDVESESEEDEVSTPMGLLPVVKDACEMDSVKDKEGNVYDGQWKDGVRCGRGMLFANDGSVYCVYLFFYILGDVEK
jgi:hypothetical protein